jgi:hypothetical protein
LNHLAKEDKFMSSAKPGKMDATNQVASSEPGLSTNMTNSSLNKREKLVARILATKFYTTPLGEPGADEEVILNPITKDLIINGYTGEHHTRFAKRKQSKRQKTEVKTEVVESVGENQPAWLDTLKEEISKMK